MKLFVITPAKRRSFLLLPLVIFPGLILVFYTLHGGGGGAMQGVKLGLNTQLPQPGLSGRQLLDKKLQYEAAERDSIRKAQFQRQDPYRRDSGMISGVPKIYTGRGLAPVVGTMRASGAGEQRAAEDLRSGQDPRVEQDLRSAQDPRAVQVLEQLRQLQQVIQKPSSPAGHPVLPLKPGGYGASSYGGGLRPGETTDTVGDAKVGRLNEMLDKVIRIQHPEESRTEVATGQTADMVEPADSTANTISAVVANDQTLTAGATLALRITDSIRVEGRVWPAGQLVYGTVRIDNDRMTVRVSSLREDRSLYVTDLQVYDLDGLPGIHIPGVLGRDVLKQSADQGVNSLNVLNADPSLSAQAANAGIQTVKLFMGRKVRQVRVTVRAGYQVLLREAHPRERVLAGGAGFKGLPAVVPSPGFVPDGPVIAHCRVEGVELRLRSIRLIEGRLWFGLEWSNTSAIVYSPVYCRWFIRNRRQVRRTALQELSLEPLSDPGSLMVAGDSVVHSWTGFVPFAIGRDKELVLETGEKGAGRVLQLVIKHGELLNAKDYGKEKRESADGPGDRAL